MRNEWVEVTPRSFKIMSIPGLSNKAREAVNAALDAMSTWRTEAADNSEKNCKQVIEKMAAAADALGWPEQVVEAARAQMKNITEMQIKTMDQIMDAWEEQLKLPDPAIASPSRMLSKLGTLPGLGQPGSWPGADAFQMAPMNPFQFWMRFAEQWQQSWADTMTFWAKAGKVAGGAGPRH